MQSACGHGIMNNHTRPLHLHLIFLCILSALFQVLIFCMYYAKQVCRWGDGKTFFSSTKTNMAGVESPEIMLLCNLFLLTSSATEIVFLYDSSRRHSDDSTLWVETLTGANCMDCICPITIHAEDTLKYDLCLDKESHMLSRCKCGSRCSYRNNVHILSLPVTKLGNSFV